MADVARLLPRHWDGQRLLRFLTGLALLALAFAAHAGLISASPVATPAPAVAAPAPAAVAAPAPAEDAVPADRPAAAGDAVRIGEQSKATGDMLRIGEQSKATGDVLRIGEQSKAVPGGVVPGAHGSRGPPPA